MSVNQKETTPSVWCVMMGVGFPGLAQANRVTMIGRALQAAGCRFRVCHVGANPLREVPPSGTHEGIPFQYYPENMAYCRSRLARRLAFLRGLQAVLWEMKSARQKGEKIVVYSWLSTNAATVWFRYMLRKLSIPVITEANEWWPGKLVHIRRGISVLQSDGLLVISAAIEKRFRETFCGRKIPILKIPILTDVLKVKPNGTALACQNGDPFILWCGNAASSPKDISFMLDVMAQVIKTGCTIRLVIAGRTTEQFIRDVQTLIKERDLPDGIIDIAGYLSDEDLSRRMSAANGLLLPLWADEERSVCRFPTKLAEYLATARPVITSSVGEVGEYLTPGPSAILCPSGDVAAYASAVLRLFKDAEWANQIGGQGRKAAEENFDFRTHANELRGFFVTGIQNG
jgi:glycosyltransferase involved in cell wall biosynthesis